MTWAGVAMVVVAATAYSLATTYPGYAVALPVLGAAAVIAGGTVAPTRGAESVLGLAPFRQVGRWSYSWYLWHWPVLVVYVAWRGTTLAATPLIVRLALVAGSLVLAVATYHLVENPVRHSPFLMGSPRATAVGAVLLVGSCVALTYAF